LAVLRSRVSVIVHTFHGNVFQGYFMPLASLLVVILERFLARRSSAIIAISPQQRIDLTEIHRICSAEKIRLIPLGFNLSAFVTEMEEKRSQFRNRYALSE